MPSLHRDDEIAGERGAWLHGKGREAGGEGGGSDKEQLELKGGSWFYG